MIPVEEWLSIVKAYSVAIWPAQVTFYLAAILVTGWFLLKPGRAANNAIKLYLAAAFAWNGIMWFFILAREMGGDGYGNYLFGAIFIVVSALFAIDLFRHRMQFAIPSSGWQRHLTLTLLILVFCYPLFGLALGHDAGRLMYPGTYPCPTTALGIIFLVTALPQVSAVIYILLLFLAIPFTPFVQILRYGVYEDVILFVSGVYGLLLYLRSKRA